MRGIYSSVTVVLPTYNEEGSIGKLMSAIIRRYPGISIIVADDGSTDRTKSVVMSLARAHRRIRFLDRSSMKRRKGLTGSVIDGIMESGTKFAIVMDADMQHPFDRIGDISEKLDSGNDIAVAVRKSVEGWQMYRKLISKALITLGYAELVLLGRERSSDIFSGYFGIRRRFFKNIYMKNRGRFVGEGYKILFDILKCIRKGDAKIAEVPYAFASRKEGRSKAGARQAIALIRSFLS